jgi:ribonuclease HI
MYHQVNCSAIQYLLVELMPIQRRWTPSINCNHLNPEAGVGVVLPPPPQGDIIKYAIQLKFLAPNNIIEYEGLVTGLRLAKDLDIWRLLIRDDSQLVAKQVQKEYECNNDKMAEYLA